MLSNVKNKILNNKNTEKCENKIVIEFGIIVSI